MPREAEAEELRKAVLAVRDKVAGELADIDPSDLLLILQSLLRPPGSGRIFFLRRLDAHRHVF